MLRRKTYAADTRAFDTPFRRAQQVWDERIGATVRQARNWRLVALLTSTACLLLTGGIVYTATTIRTYPYIIEVAETGQVRTVGKLVDPSYVIPNPVKQELLKDWLIRVRTLSSDPGVMRDNLNRVWAFAGPRVRVMLKPHLEEMAQHAAIPMTDPRRKIIRMRDLSILPVTKQTYRADWTEEMSNIAGSLEQRSTWGATLTLHDKTWNPVAPITKHTDEYPLGVFLYDLNWSPLSH